MNINKQTKRDDADDLFYKVELLKTEEYCPILLYKPQGEDFDIGPPNVLQYPVDKEYIAHTFILAFQTKEQLITFFHCTEIGNILCLDSTHGTNQYGYYLVNIVIKDEFGRGIPVGHLICNSENEQNLYYFFDAIKGKLQENFGNKIVIRALMTDDDNAGWAGFRKVFGNHIDHLLCIWHVIRSWRRKLHALLRHNLPLQSELFQASRILMYEKDYSKFKRMEEMFIKTYENECPEYVQYFVEYYLKRPQVWAMCFRHGLKDHTNMLVESFHNKLKTHYMKRIPNKKITSLLELLEQIEKDDYYNYQMRCVKEVQVDSPKDSSWHHKGIKIMDSDVVKCSEDTWNVNSQESSIEERSKIYEIKFLGEDCFGNACFEKCYEDACSGLCKHVYQCNCQDENNLCKHIHKVHSLRVRSYDVPRFVSEVPDIQDVNYMDEESISFYHTEIVEENLEERNSEITWKRTELGLEEISNFIKDPNVRKNGKFHISNAVEQLKLKCKLFQQTEQKAQSKFKVTHEIQPRSKLQLQPRSKRQPFRSTKKQKKRKKKTHQNHQKRPLKINYQEHLLKALNLQKVIHMGKCL